MTEQETPPAADHSIFAPIKAKCPQPLPWNNACQCEKNINIGVFFDGTDNNKTHEKSANTNTNVVRLWEAYNDEVENGYYSHYISGVGTPFTELGKQEAEDWGGPFGAGGKARIIYGLLQVINSVHRFAGNDKYKFNDIELRALCSSKKSSALWRLDEEQLALKKLGLAQGLDDDDDRINSQFFEGMRQDISLQLKQSKRKVVGIYLDVFGFSRGATQARVFVNWLYKYLLIDGKLFGVPAYVRILGIFDTVATVGGSDAIPGGTGHNSWATAENLKIHRDVKNCYHIIALHELRANFPLDSVAVDGIMPPNCQEVYAPGAHSDVGGGYGPGDQGKVLSPQLLAAAGSQVGSELLEESDGYKLSHLALNQMLAAAKKSSEFHPSPPWLNLDAKTDEKNELQQRFGIKQLALIRKDVQEYFDKSQLSNGLNVRDALREHGPLYLAWRKKVKFEKLNSVKYAKLLNDESLINYLKGEDIFRENIKVLSRADFLMTEDALNEKGYHPEAYRIFESLKDTVVRPEVGDFFDTWVHDSYAGFIAKFQGVQKVARPMAEAQGYFRWRGLFAGSDERVNRGVLPKKTS